MVATSQFTNLLCSMQNSVVSECQRLVAKIHSRRVTKCDAPECVHESFGGSSQFALYLINTVSECLASNGCLEPELHGQDLLRLVESMVHLAEEGLCLQCTSLIGCQITHTFARNKGYRDKCRFEYKPTAYSICITNLIPLLLAQCLAYPSVSDYFLLKTEIYRVIVSLFTATFQGGAPLPRDAGEAALTQTTAGLRKTWVARLLITSNIRHMQWRELILRQKLLLDLFKILVGIVKWYFAIKQRSDFNATQLDATLEDMRHLFIITAFAIHHAHRCLTDSQKEAYVDEKYFDNRVYRHNAVIGEHFSSISQMLSAHFRDKQKRLTHDEHFIKVFMQSVLLLIEKEYMEKSECFYRMFRRPQLKTIRYKRKVMKCHWHLCNKRRVDCKGNEFRKCAKCQVSRYCSRLHQKLDWKCGHHQSVCKLYCTDPHAEQQKRKNDLQVSEMLQCSRAQTLLCCSQGFPFNKK